MVPDWDRFLAAPEWATRFVPRFRQRVVEPMLGVGVPAWVVDPDFDLHYHVRRVRLPDGATFADMLATAEQIAMTPFDTAPVRCGRPSFSRVSPMVAPATC